MRFGLRFLLLLLLAALMLLSFLPLFIATSTYTRLGLERLQHDNAVRMGRSVASQLAVARKHLEQHELVEWAQAALSGESVAALALLSPTKEAAVLLGDATFLSNLNASSFAQRPGAHDVTAAHGRAILFYQPDPAGGVVAVVRVEAEVARAMNLSALMALYMAVGGFLSLVIAYFALTRWIVRPIVVLEQAAERVAQGQRRLAPIASAPRELLHLSQRLSQMTDTLRDDEESLRAKMKELQAKTEELRVAEHSLKRSERLATVGRLAAGLAHEVGNPISALMGLLDLLLSGDLSREEQRDFLERMRKETARIDRVLSDLLAYARSGQRHGPSGGAGDNTSACAVASAVTSVLALLRPQTDFRAVTLETSIEAQLPPVPLSEEELIQVLLNLLMNAADACGDEGTIRVSARRENTNGWVVIEVEDSGPGIAPAVFETLFEPFVTTKDVGKGTGLGLSVTKGLVEGAGGTIEGENRVPVGAQFTVRLPFVKDFRSDVGDC